MMGFVLALGTLARVAVWMYHTTTHAVGHSLASIQISFGGATNSDGAAGPSP